MKNAKGNIELWAVPRSTWEVTPDSPATHEYKMYIAPGKPYQTEAVLVKTTTFIMPYEELTQTELTTTAVENLEAKAKEVRLEAAQELATIQNRIAELLALPAPE